MRAIVFGTSQGMHMWSDACQRVGYVSASQFGRDYARFFGSAPTKDVARLRQQGLAPTDAAR
jgi:transcriptional regulator GlxA family with amidase domain